MCRWITGIAMGWLGLVTQCFAGMGEKQKKPPKQLSRSACCSLENSLYKPPRELRGYRGWHLHEYY